ncbi:MAG: hypothetical protein NC489_19620 [Ruminococcus flavefaciens]|nr:hypothetical protein [Ruminococcus flavefaciens]
MSAYEKIYKKPYPDGWKNLPSRTTPVVAAVLDQYDSTISHIEEYLAGLETEADMSGYATTGYVDRKVNEALTDILEGAS